MLEPPDAGCYGVWYMFSPRTVLCLFTAVAFAIQSEAASDVILARGKKSEWVIRAASTNESAPVQFAAEELQKYLRQMSGAKLAIGRHALRSKEIVICVRKQLSPADRNLLPPKKTGYDGYAISIRDDRIIIAGNNGPGCVYGIYDFLERLGCRWFYPTIDSHDPEVVPKLSVIELAATNWAVASPIKNRICNGDAWYFELNLKSAKAELDWAMKNRYNAMGWQAAVSTSKRSCRNNMTTSVAQAFSTNWRSAACSFTGRHIRSITFCVQRLLRQTSGMVRNA